MKKIIYALICVVMLGAFTGCGNKDVWDSNYTYDYAIVEFPNGEVKTIDVKQWSDYDGEQIQIISQDGKIYLINSINAVLVRE